MKNSSRFWRKFLIITSIFIGSLVVAVLILWKEADSLLTNLADRKLKEFIARSDSFSLSYSRLDLNLAKGTVRLNDISFLKDSISAIVKTLEAGNINPRKVWKTRKLMLDYIELDGVKLSAVLRQKSDTLNVKHKDTIKNQHPSALQKYLDTIGVEEVILDGAGLTLSRKGSRMKLDVGDLDLNVRDIVYDISSGGVTYCDSLYDLRLTNLAYTSADGLYALSLDSLSTQNSGGVSISNLHGRNTVGKKELSARKGNIPVSWTDLQINNLHTSKVNLIRTAIAGNINIDSVILAGKQIEVFRDNRHLPKAPIKMPQQALSSIPIPLNIGQLKVQMTYLKIGTQPKSGSAGSLLLHDVDMTVSGLSNQAGSTVRADLKPRLGKGRGNIHLSLTLDKNSSFSAKASISNVKGSDFQTLLEPMFGVSVNAEIKKLDASITGNSFSSGGSFCMQYSDLQVTMKKQEVPDQKLANKAGLINKLVGAAIHKQNPRKDNEDPFRCNVSAKRDPMKPFGAYIVSNLTDGIEQTVLRKLPLKEVSKLLPGGKKKKKR